MDFILSLYFNKLCRRVKMTSAVGVLVSLAAILICAEATFDLDSLYSTIFGDESENELNDVPDYSKMYGQSEPEKWGQKEPTEKTFGSPNLIGPEATFTEFFAEYKVPLTQVNFTSFFQNGGFARTARTFYPSSGNNTYSNGTTFSQVVTYNTNSILLLGGLVIVGLIVFPALGQNLGLTNRNSRFVEDVGVIDKMNDYILKTYHVDSKSCMDLIVCSASAKLTKSKKSRDVKPYEKVIEGIMNLNPIKKLLKKSKFQKSIDIGMKGYDCDSEYKKCPFTLPLLEELFNSYLNSIKKKL